MTIEESHNQKLAASNAYVYRALNICSSDGLLKAEIDYITSIAIDRGFTVEIIDSIHNKLSKRSHSKVNTVGKEN